MVVCLCLLLVVLPRSANATEEPDFAMLDRDRDGRLSPREVQALSVDFTAFDSNRNGYLSRNEIQEGLANPAMQENSSKSPSPPEIDAEHQ